MASVIADSRSPMVLSPLGSLDIILQSMSKAGCAGEIWPEQMQQTGLFAALIGNLLFGDVSVQIRFARDSLVLAIAILTLILLSRVLASHRKLSSFRLTSFKSLQDCS